jgi:hypothetical protein
MLRADILKQKGVDAADDHSGWLTEGLGSRENGCDFLVPVPLI